MDRYSLRLHSIDREDSDGLERFINELGSTEYSRGVFGAVFEQLLTYIKATSHEKQTLQACIKALRTSSLSFNDLELDARLRLVELYQHDQDHHRAAVTLQEFLSFQRDVSDTRVVDDTDTNTTNEDRRIINNEKKFELYVMIIRNYLECDEPENAMAMITKAQYLRPSVVSQNLDPTLDIHFKLSQARVYDSSRRFLEAASKYYQVSREPLVEEADSLKCLTQAIVSGVLSPAGPRRSNVLRLIYNDERSKHLPQYPILEKVCFDRLLSGEDVAMFSQYCSEHQLAELPDGGHTTVLSRAVIDHNVLSISKVYKNIRLVELAKLLNMSEVNLDLVETFVCKMISQNRLQAKIDQTDGFIYFRSPLDSVNGLSNSSSSTTPNGTTTNNISSSLGLGQEMSAANHSIASLTSNYDEKSSTHLLLKQQDALLSRLTARLDELVSSLPNLDLDLELQT